MPHLWRRPSQRHRNSTETSLLLALCVLSLITTRHVAASASTRIKHVVVLMMENRSFDHMLGWTKRADQSNPDATVDGLTGAECNPIVAKGPGDGGDADEGGENSQAGGFVQVCVNKDARYDNSEDPDHSFKGTRNQIFGGSSLAEASPQPMRGFAQQAEEVRAGFSAEVMSAFPPDALPVTSALAANFAVCDRWFSSVPGPTHPNRFFLHTATSKGLLAERKAVLLLGLKARTIFDVLSARGVSFGIYFHDIPASLALRSLRTRKHSRKFRPIELFYAHARVGRLPAYSFLEPQYFDFVRQPGNDDHPGHDMRHGQQLIKDVYEALRAGPQWKSTLFIVTYDEHGGFYDHVQPPMGTGVPSPDGIVGEEEGFLFRRLGVRVPTFVISPWIDAGTVIHAPQGPYPSSQFEHASVAATLRDVFGLKSNKDRLTKRDSWAGSLMPFLSLRSSPRSNCPWTLPSVTSISRSSGVAQLTYSYNGSQTLTALQQDMLAIAAAISPVPLPPTALDPFISRLLQNEAGVFVRVAMAHFMAQQGTGGGSGVGEGAGMRVMACDQDRWWCRVVVRVQRLLGFTERETSGSEASGSEASGSEASGSEASGSEASGSEAIGSASSGGGGDGEDDDRDQEKENEKQNREKRKEEEKTQDKEKKRRHQRTVSELN